MTNMSRCGKAASASLAAVLILCLIPHSSAMTPASDQLVHEWEPSADSDGIDLAYRCLFLIYYDVTHRSYEAQTKALRCADILVSRQRESGVIMRREGGANVNDKLMTSIGTWALAAAYGYSGDDRYASAAERGGDFLIDEMRRWEETYPAACDDDHVDRARNGGASETCLTSYCWTSPNDLGIVAAALGALPYHGIGDERYREACMWLADALYEMQLDDGSWYDGYAERYPTRWDRSCHYIAMAMMGPWMAYNITGEERYRTSLEEAWAWLVTMQAPDGSVHDIWVDEVNMHKAPRMDHPHDFTQVDGQTDVKDYHASPAATYLGEFSLLFAASMLEQLGLDSTGAGVTRSRLEGRISFSNWYLLSQVLPSGMGDTRFHTTHYVDTGVRGQIAPFDVGSALRDRYQSFLPFFAVALLLAAAFGAWKLRRR